MASEDIVVTNIEFDELDKFTKTTDKFESLFTIIVHSLTIDELLTKLKLHLNKCKGINNNYRRNYILGKMSGLIDYYKEKKLEPNESNKINSVILYSDSPHILELTKKQVNTLCEYDVCKYSFMYGNSFYIDYIKDIFTNFKFINVIEIKNKELRHYAINLNKCKQISKKTVSNIVDIMNYIKTIDDICIIHGVSTLLKDVNETKHILIANRLVPQTELFSIYNSYEMKKKHQDLVKCFEYIKNDKMLHMVIYGKDEIYKAIEDYKIKKLFVHSNMLSEIRNKFKNLNFEIIEIFKISENDVSDNLLNNYSGLFGLTYY